MMNVIRQKPTTLAAPLVIELGWPERILWPNVRAGSHYMRVSSAKRKAREEAFWATKYAKPLNWKHDGSRLKMTIEARPETTRNRDDDNLISACKAVRDGIADALGINDNLFDVQPVRWGEKHDHGGRLFITIGDAP